MNRVGIRLGGQGILGFTALVSLATASTTSCRTSTSTESAAAPMASAPITVASTLPADDAAAPPLRPGMIYIPAGKLAAGTPPAKTPRIADEEVPGTPVELSAYYMDIYPFPNEAGAIPTTNVTLEDAVALCKTKGKRLCTELEWERACKGPEQLTYEYGNAYRESVCGTGVLAEEASKRPMGERLQCKSAFGVAELHGGVWEWTDSRWGRGRPEGLRVLRGGNARAGELVGRCANALGRPGTSKNATIGFRCCAGERNSAVVDLELKMGIPLEVRRDAKDVQGVVERALPLEGPETLLVSRVWTWRPIPNEELRFVIGCLTRKKATIRCEIVVARPGDEKAIVDVPIETGFPSLSLLRDPEHVRLKALDAKGVYVRDFTYVAGRVDVSDPKR